MAKPKKGETVLAAYQGAEIEVTVLDVDDDSMIAEFPDGRIERLQHDGSRIPVG